MKTRIKGGTIITAAGSFAADIFCVDGVISSIGEADAFAADVEVDSTGKLVFPGFIDPHVHSRDPGLTYKEDFAHSTRAAAAGGVTTILEMPNAVPPVTSAALLAERAEQHERVAHVDFGLWGMALGETNVGDLTEMLDAGAAAIKLFWAYALNKDTMQLVYNLGDLPPESIIPPPSHTEVLDVFRTVAESGGLLAAHCEDRGVVASAERALGHPVESYEDLLAARPGLAENAAIALAIEFARATRCRFHVVHMASGRSTELVRRAQRDGVRITAETCPQYLTLTDADYAGVGGAMKVFPPIQRASDRDALWEAVRDGTITSVGSDHAPHSREEKRAPLDRQPAGILGVETIAAVMTSEMAAGRIAPERLAWVLSEGTARLYGLYPRKGAIIPGADADFTIVDPKRIITVDNSKLHSKEPLSAWSGRTLHCVPECAILRGEVIMREGDPVGQHRGRFLRANHTAVADAVEVR